MKKPKSVSIREVTVLLAHYFGKDPKGIKPVGGGVANHVFEAQVGREQLIVRISTKPHKLQVFIKEQWAITRARESGVPTPEVLQVGNEIIGLPFMISRKVPGPPATGFRDNPSLLEELGGYAAKINAIPTHDFGPMFDWSPNKLSRRRTWQEYLDAELRVEERCEVLERAGLLERANLSKLRGQIKRMRQWEGKPTLSHGDLRLKNLILDDQGKITAILDWEKTTSNLAPYWELSLALHDLTVDEKEMFLRGYGLDPKAYAKLAPGIKALNLLNYAKTARIAMAHRNKALLLSLRIRLNGGWDLYSL
jgi:aminoglycoside phosphotransferase (APT) family kinase protein